MKAKEFIPQSKPRNFVVKNQKTAGAGAHKDKKKAEKQGDIKHKGKQFDEGVAEGNVMEYETHRYTDDQGNEWEVNDEGDRTLIKAAPGSSYGRGSSRYNRPQRYKPFNVPSQQKKGMYFYNVNDPQTAQKLGLKQSKSGKWYLPAGSFQKDTADKVFGAGKYWEPKN